MRKKKFSKEEVDTIYENFLMDCIEKIDFKATFETEKGSRQIRTTCKGGEEIDSIPPSHAYWAISRAVLFPAKELSDRLEAKAMELLEEAKGESKEDK